MSTDITFRTLYGGSSTRASCSLLRINTCNILLDCGWDEEYDPELLKPLEEIIDEIDAVLLSHADPAHLGALPYLVGNCKLQAPIYATVPVHRMGQMFMYDQYLSWWQTSDFKAFSLDDVDAAFQRIRQLKYHQQVKLAGKGQGISVTAFAAGHLIGGSIWQILTPEEEQIVYAMHWNHRKDRHLKRADLEGRFSRPALLITDACNALARSLDINHRDADFLKTVTNTLQADGNVLIPVDTAGRVLEVAILLEQHWQRFRLPFAIVLLTPVAYSTLEFAKSQLEWMNQDISDIFSKTRSNPFEFKHITTCHSKDNLWELPPGPRIVMASLPSLAAGMSLQLLIDWAPNPNNLIVFLSQAPEGSVAAQVQQKSKLPPSPLQLQIFLGRRVPLTEEELEELQRTVQDKQYKPDLQHPAAPGGEQWAVTQADSDLDESPRGNSWHQEQDITQISSVLAPAELLKPKLRDVMLDGFEALQGADCPMFPPDEESKAEWTEYGQILKSEDLRRVLGSDDIMEVDSDEEAEDTVPTKVVSTEVAVNIRAAVAVFNFEGVADPHSIQTVLAKVAPRHLIITHGTAEAKAALCASCAARSEIKWQVHQAIAGEEVNASSGSSSFKANLTDSLLESLHSRNVGEYSVSWLTAKATQSEEEGLCLTTNLEDGSLNVMEGGIFVGDVKLSSLRKALTEGGITSEFFGGTLLCQKRIVVRSVGSAGLLVLEGPCCKEYFDIRNILYAQFNVC